MNRTLLVLFTLLLSTAANAENVTVLTGDTLEFGGITMRLRGIVAPRLDDTCIIDGKEAPIGQFAANQMRSAIGRELPICRPAGRQGSRGTDFVVECLVRQKVVRDGVWTSSYRDLARVLVERGAAWDYPVESLMINAPAESRARTAQRGIWLGDCRRPLD